MRDIRNEIEKVNEIVTLPTILTEIMGELNKDEAVTFKITRMVETDAALTSSILRVVNSPFYGLRHEVANVGNAITLLGHSEISRILITFFMKQQFRKLSRHQESYLERLWSHSLNTAALATLISREFNIGLHGEEYTAALLHDIGKIVLIQQFAPEFDSITETMKQSGRADVDVEKEILGMSHDEIGGMLGDRWRLPPELVEVLKFHHSPGNATHYGELTTIVRFADLMAETLDFGIGEGKTLVPDNEDESYILLGKMYPLAKALGQKEVLNRLSAKHVEQKSLVGMF